MQNGKLTVKIDGEEEDVIIGNGTITLNNSVSAGCTCGMTSSGLLCPYCSGATIAPSSGPYSPSGSWTTSTTFSGVGSFTYESDVDGREDYGYLCGVLTLVERLFRDAIDGGDPNSLMSFQMRYYFNPKDIELFYKSMRIYNAIERLKNGHSS